MADDLALETKQEASATPQKELRRWLLEIKLAEKREKEWRKVGQSIINIYRGTKRKKNSFNILWANTEVLRPALYNSTPKPDVRRRFRQSDVLGKAVGEVAERSLSYCVDAYDLDACLKNDVLDSLLPGRGLSRVRYIPQFKQVAESAEGQSEAFEGTHEELEYEQALCDHVQWDDFLHGPGKIWGEVPWVAFRHRMTRDDLVDKFGDEIGKEITLDDVDDDDLTDKQASDIKDAFKRAMLWEIWDKDGGKVFFVNQSYKKGVIFPKDSKGEPPLNFKDFFPCPQPLMMVEDTGSLIPIPLYELYREQAEELERISTRINKIINQCRVRFVYDPTLSELKGLMDANDGEGIAAEQARAWMSNGGIEKAIWWMPVEQLAAVLKELYVSRESAKQVIYEITGLSDILRGSTDPNETLGAQKLKANSSSMRLQRMQREVQRYVRDLIRLLAEVIGENFQPETLAQMTGLQFPTALQKQQIQLQLQAAQQQGQLPPEVQQKLQMAQKTLSMPTWEDIMGVLSNDMQRSFRVDIETDSTVAESLTQDMEGMREVLTSVVEFWQGVGPAVQAGAVNIEAVKALTMSIVRRARMGLEVEDALETGMQAPKPETDPRAAAEAQRAQLEQQKAAHDAEMAKVEEQRQQMVEMAKHQREQDAAAAQAALDRQRMEYEARLASDKAEREDALARYKIDQDNATKIVVAEIAAQATLDASLASAEQKANEEISGVKTEGAAKVRRKGPIDKLADMHAESMNAMREQGQTHANTMQQLMLALQAPRETVLVRDGAGRAHKSVSKVVPETMN